jgi:hypothetical protein
LRGWDLGRLHKADPQEPATTCGCLFHYRAIVLTAGVKVHHHASRLISGFKSSPRYLRSERDLRQRESLFRWSLRGFCPPFCTPPHESADSPGNKRDPGGCCVIPWTCWLAVSALRRLLDIARPSRSGCTQRR